MKIKILLGFITGLFLLLPPNLGAKVVERIVALVNDEVITLSDVEEMGKPLYERVRETTPPPERQEKMEEVERQGLDHLIENKLLDQEIKKRKIEVPERDVDAAIEDILQSSHLTLNDLKKTVAQEGITFSTYRQKVREEIGKMRLVNREIKSKIVIEEERIRKAYQENLEKFTNPLEVKIQQILLLLPRNAPQEVVAAIRREAQSILERARKGEDFAELAKKYSQGPEAGEGGVLGFFKHKELMPDLEEAGFKLEAGEISDLVRSPLGFHILRVMERKGGKPIPFSKVEPEIRAQMVQKEAEKKYNEWMKDLKAKSYIEIRW